MAYDEELAERVREQLQEQPRLTERRMFGGLAFMVQGHMAVVVSGREQGLMLRCQPERTAALLEKPGTRATVMRGRALEGWIDLDAAAVDDDGALAQWVGVAVAYALSLPPRDS